MSPHRFSLQSHGRAASSSAARSRPCRWQKSWLNAFAAAQRSAIGSVSCHMLNFSTVLQLRPVGHHRAPRYGVGRHWDLQRHDPGEGGGDRQRRRQFAGADSAEPFLCPRSAAGERQRRAESPPVRRGAGRRALRQRAGGDRHCGGASSATTRLQAQDGQRAAPQRRQVLLHRRAVCAAHPDAGDRRRRPRAAGLRPAPPAGRRGHRRLVRLRPAHHRQRFSVVFDRVARRSAAGRRGLVPGRLRAPDHRRPVRADSARGHRRRDRPRRLRGHPAFRPRARPALGRLRRRQGQRRPTDHP